MLFRLLFTLALLGALIWFWRRNRRSKQLPTQQQDTASETMVRCAQCNIHLPRRLALQQQEHWYCSQAHQQQGPARREH